LLVAIKIDLFTLRSVNELLPSLLDLLQEYEVKASFFPALGPDPETAPRLFQRLLGTMPAIAEQATNQLQAIVKRGHEVGAVPWDVAAWRRLVLERDADWTREQVGKGTEGFRKLFADKPRYFAAPGFLVNADTSAIEGELGFEYALDTRGLFPYRSMNPDGSGRCPQVPVTLPRIEDLLATGESPEDVHQVLFMESQKPLEQGHVFNFTADYGGHLPVLEKLLVMWKGSQREPSGIGRMLDGLDTDSLPCHRSGLVQLGEDGPFQAVQGQRVEND